MSEDRGVVYVATGDPYVAEARQSALTVAEWMPDVEICLMTDGKPAGDWFDSVVELPDPRYDFGDQVYHLDRSPYEKTIFLDSDIYLTDSIADVFDLLDTFDVAASQNEVNYSSERLDESVFDHVPPAFPEYNTGVVAYRQSERVDALFERWQVYYERVLEAGQIHNQAAFRHALYDSDVRLATLPDEYNCIFRRPGSVNGRVRVLHGRLRDIDGPGAGKSFDIEDVAATLNARTDRRAYHPIAGGVKLCQATRLEKLRHSLRNRGLRGTGIRAVEKLGSRFDRGG